jgi:hypothetical protein
MDLTERVERPKLDHGLHRSLEEDRQHDDVSRRCGAEAGRHLDVVVRHVGEQNRLLLECGLADQSLSLCESVGDMLASLVRIARNELEEGLPALAVHHVERAVLRTHERCDLGHDLARHGLQVLLPLHHPRELREVRLEPVLLAVSLGRLAQVRDHLIEVAPQLLDLALRLDRDLPREIASRDRGGDFGDRPHLRGEVVRHRVYVVRQPLPRAGDVGHLGLAAQLALGAHLARHARDLVGEDPQAVHHVVDRALQLENLT